MQAAMAGNNPPAADGGSGNDSGHDSGGSGGGSAPPSTHPVKEYLETGADGAKRFKVSNDAAQDRAGHAG
jgi:hypothetical protein